MKPFEYQPLPIQEIEWEPLIPLIGRTNRAIAKYDGILYGVPNPAVLLSPLTTREAVLSSRIEGTVATLTEVLKYEAGDETESESKRHDIGEIVNYRRALRQAETALQTYPFSLNLLLNLHGTLLNSVRGRDKNRGSFRTTQNWIGDPTTPIKEAKFIPPDALAVPQAMHEWEKYYHAESPDPIVQLAIIHAQFEIIHPFLDGNGRLGRILVPLFLYEKKLLSQPVFYVSAYLEDRRDEYVARLRALGREPGVWNRWIAFFLDAVFNQAQENESKARTILDLYERMKARVIELTHSQYAVPLLDQLFDRPIFRSTGIQLAGDQPSRQAIANLLSILREDGILTVLQPGSGRRPQTLVFAELINVCEADEVLG